MSEQALLNCPFCGSNEPIIHHIEPHTHFFVDLPDHEGSYTIECRGCDLGFIKATKEEAIAAWNRRAPPNDTPVAYRIYRSGRWCFAYAEDRCLCDKDKWEPLYAAPQGGRNDF